MNGALQTWVPEKSWKPKIRRFSRRNGLIGDGAEFDNDVRLNRESMKRIQDWDRIGKPRKRFDNHS